MIITMETAHQVVFYSLYALVFLATFLFVERLLYLSFSYPAEKKLFLKEIEEFDQSKLEARYHLFVSKLRRGMGFLSFTITVSPLLGLLGTVLGIMKSFLVMAERGTGNLLEVSKGIGFALEATALGIFVAVVALIYYHVVNGMINKAKTEIKALILENMKRWR
ncbi:MAG: MotA/TolQ/ExbB proton channel family protein [Desulfurobacteriaceae bacterium]